MGYCKLDNVIQALDIDARRDIMEKLAKLEEQTGGRQAVANLRLEDLVEREIWIGLVEELKSSAKEWDAIHDVVMKIMRGDQLNGRVANCPADTVFGRATTAFDLAYVFMGNGHHGSVEAATDEIEYCKMIPGDELRLAWGSYKLGQWVMWATFDPDGEDPFAKVAWEPPDHLRAHLGLSKVDSTKPLLLLRYKLPAGKARMPRVTEAYSAQIWTHFFRPAGVKEQREGYGLTFPWDDVAEDGGSGLPEVVHEPIEGEYLFDRMIELK